MNRVEADKIIEMAYENQIVLEPYENKTGEMEISVLKWIVNSLVREPAHEQEDERGERQQVIRYVKHDINCQCGKCGTGMMAWEVQDKILTANEQEDEKVHNIHCPECGEFIGVGLLMYNPNASKPYDPHEVED